MFNLLPVVSEGRTSFQLNDFEDEDRQCPGIYLNGGNVVLEM